MVKTVEFQDFFDFIWGGLMGDRAADMMSEEVNKFLDTPGNASEFVHI